MSSKSMTLIDLFPCIDSKQHSLFAVYGTNDGLVQGILKEIQDHFSFCHVDINAIDDHIDFLQQPILFGKKPTITLMYGQPSQKKVTHICNQWPKEYVLIFVGTSPKGFMHPSLRKVPCYTVSYTESKIILARQAQKNNVCLDKESLDFCGHHAKEGSWSQWISFLSLYPGNKITFDILKEYADIMLDEKQRINENKSFLKGLSFEKLASVQRTLIQARWIKSCLKHQSMADAKKSVYPLLFFKDDSQVTALAKHTSFDDLLTKMERSLYLENIMKQYAS